MRNYDNWLAGLLGQDVADVRALTTNRTALQFLLAWTLFESKCFAGFLKKNMIGHFASRLANVEAFDTNSVREAIAHFHERYQDPDRYRNLMHQQRSPKLEGIFRKSLGDLTEADKLFLLLFVIYRFRNNMFHGNKKIQSWLRYTPQIDYCVCSMQQIISHKEGREETMRMEVEAHDAV